MVRGMTYHSVVRGSRRVRTVLTLFTALLLCRPSPSQAGPPTEQDRYRQCREAIKAAAVQVLKVGGWAHLGDTAFDCGEPAEAIRGYTAALDRDPHNRP